jgi:hypothetical protein
MHAMATHHSCRRRQALPAAQLPGQGASPQAEPVWQPLLPPHCCHSGNCWAPARPRHACHWWAVWSIVGRAAGFNHGADPTWGGARRRLPGGRERGGRLALVVVVVHKGAGGPGGAAQPALQQAAGVWCQQRGDTCQLTAKRHPTPDRVPWFSPATIGRRTGPTRVPAGCAAPVSCVFRLRGEPRKKISAGLPAKLNNDSKRRVACLGAAFRLYAPVCGAGRVSRWLGVRPCGTGSRRPPKLGARAASGRQWSRANQYGDSCMPGPFPPAAASNTAASAGWRLRAAASAARAASGISALTLIWKGQEEPQQQGRSPHLRVVRDAARTVCGSTDARHVRADELTGCSRRQSYWLLVARLPANIDFWPAIFCPFCRGWPLVHYSVERSRDIQLQPHRRAPAPSRWQLSRPYIITLGPARILSRDGPCGV